MAPAAGRQLARRRSRILRLEHVHEHQLQLARIGTVGELQHGALPGLALVRAETLVRLEQHDRTADVLAVRAGNGRLPVALEPGLHRPRAGGEEQPILAPQLEPGRPAGHGARLVPERPLVRSAQTDGAGSAGRSARRCSFSFVSARAGSARGRPYSSYFFSAVPRLRKKRSVRASGWMRPRSTKRHVLSGGIMSVVQRRS